LFEVNPSSFYGAKLFVDGMWLILRTDDQFACNYNSPIYAKPNSA